MTRLGKPQVKSDKTKPSLRQKQRGIPVDRTRALSFAGLVDAIRSVHEQLSRHAMKAVNISLTVRNWQIGFYIREYEQHGSDRAKYGENLLERLAERLQHLSLERVDARELRRYRLFYVRYPQIRETVSPEFYKNLPPGHELSSPEILGTASPELAVAGKKLLLGLSFSHFDELLEIDDSLKRVFYEVECMKGGWSVRELRRQIASLYFERCGLSKNKKALSRITQAKAEAAGGHPALHRKEPRPCKVCSCGYGQSAIRFPVPTQAPQRRRTAGLCRAGVEE